MREMWKTTHVDVCTIRFRFVPLADVYLAHPVSWTPIQVSCDYPSVAGRITAKATTVIGMLGYPMAKRKKVAQKRKA